MHFTPHFRCKSSSSRRSGAKLSYVFIGVNAFLRISDISVKICCSSEYGKQNKLRPQTNLLGEVQWPKNLSFQEFTVGGAGLKLSDRNTRMMETCSFEIFPILRPSSTSSFDAFSFQQWDKSMMKRLNVSVTFPFFCQLLVLEGEWVGEGLQNSFYLPYILIREVKIPKNNEEEENFSWASIWFRNHQSLREELKLQTAEITSLVMNLSQYEFFSCKLESR